jgi:hypothetical protein
MPMSMSSVLSYLLVAAVIALIFVILRGGNNPATNNSSILAVIGLFLTCLIPIVGFVVALRELLIKDQKVYIRIFSVLAICINIGISILMLWPILIYIV